MLPGGKEVPIPVPHHGAVPGDKKVPISGPHHGVLPAGKEVLIADTHHRAAEEGRRSLEPSWEQCPEERHVNKGLAVLFSTTSTFVKHQILGSQPRPNNSEFLQRGPGNYS